ncbi:MAG: hypothetical protein EXR98_17545 [Gemmataceae bacterium]|nr:hypothetical protein [Gemmataceae bacterium]
MRHKCSLLVVLLFIGLPSCNPAAELKPPEPDAVPVAAEKQLPGRYRAGSRVRDDKAPGGFAPCDNFPAGLGAKPWGEKAKLALVAFPNEPVAYVEPAAYVKHRGIALRLVNRTGETVALSASDSQLYIVQEAIDADGQWREIESMPNSWCGNSYHRVFLKPNQYWAFQARTYTGAITTKIRFRLDPSGDNDKAKPIYSNEFEGEVAKEQMRMGPDRAALRRAFYGNDPKGEGVIATLVAVLGDSNTDWRWTPIAAAVKLADSVQLPRTLYRPFKKP